MNVDYTHNLLLVRKLKEKGFDDDDVRDIIEIINSVCHYCWDTDTREHRCFCMDYD